MSILDASGSVACAECGRKARDERDRLQAENAKLREQMERLVTLLRNDCDIDASWDGLRKFWSIGLTEDGCLMRDRACKAEAENAKLRKLVVRLMGHIRHPPCDGCSFECDGTDLTRCDEWSFMEADARDLGVKEAGE